MLYRPVWLVLISCLVACVPAHSVSTQPQPSAPTTGFITEEFSLLDTASKPQQVSQTQQISASVLPKMIQQPRNKRGYILKFPSSHAALERSVRIMLEKQQDIHAASPKEENACLFDFRNVGIHTTYFQPEAQQRWYNLYDCWPSVRAKMMNGNMYTYTLQETRKESQLRAELNMSVKGVQPMFIPVKFTVEETSISCTDYRIETERGARYGTREYGEIFSYANSEMAELCTRNRGYASAPEVLDAIADYLATGIVKIMRELNK